MMGKINWDDIWKKEPSSTITTTISSSAQTTRSFMTTRIQHSPTFCVIKDSSDEMDYFVLFISLIDLILLIIIILLIFNIKLNVRV